MALAGVLGCGQGSTAQAAPDGASGPADATGSDAADGSTPDASSSDAAAEAKAPEASAQDAATWEADASEAPTAWFEGTFRYLPSTEADLVSFVGALEHPNQGGYGKVSVTRAAKLEAMLGALFDAVSLALVDGSLPDWCAVSALALDAGYDLFRFFDTATGRWVLYGADNTSYGQAYFFVNPAARRNLVVESPHDPFDWATGKQGARLFMALAARAFLLNKEHRCSDPDATTCDGTTSACDGYYRESDVAHHTENAFHLLHRYLSDSDSSARFVQLHGFQASAADMVEIGDGSSSKDEPSSVSLVFAQRLRAYVPAPGAVYACQDADGQPPSGLCGSTNVQGRATNAPGAEVCTTGTAQSSGRFLHIEQAKALREDVASDGWFWTQVRDALHDTWPDCLDADCDLGPAQPQVQGCVCGEPCD